jgi:hypothetical protein
MQGTSRILLRDSVVRQVLLSRELLSGVEDRMRDANGGSTRGWNKGKRGEVNGKGDSRTPENPKNGFHGLTKGIPATAGEPARRCSFILHSSSPILCAGATRRQTLGLEPVETEAPD